MIRMHTRGFTIIELTLAMTFVAMLLIAVATLSIQLTNQYSRGLTLKEIAQAGTEASNDIRRTISQAQIQGTGIQTVPIDGGGTVLCTGTYSYVANSSENLASPDSPETVKLGAGKLPARLAKVRDLGGNLCATRELDDNKEYMTNDVSELLSSGSRLLVVHALDVSPSGVRFDEDPDGKPTGEFAGEYKQGRGIFNVRLTIRTGVDSEFITGNESCRPPSEQESNLEFCAIDTFRFTARVGSSTSL